MRPLVVILIAMAPPVSAVVFGFAGVINRRTAKIVVECFPPVLKLAPFLSLTATVVVLAVIWILIGSRYHRRTRAITVIGLLLVGYLVCWCLTWVVWFLSVFHISWD